MADEQNHQTETETPLTTFTLPLRPRAGDGGLMAPAALTAAPPGLASPGIQVEFHGDPAPRPPPIYPSSAPPDIQSFPSPLRHHRRTPSVHREIRETLNARSEYTNEDSEGRAHHHINQYVLKDEIGRGSYGAVHLATDQFGTEYAVKAFSKTRLRKRAQSNILRNGPRQLGRFHRAGFGAPDTPIMGFADQRAKEAQDALFLIREEVAIMKKLNHPNLVQLFEVLDDPEDDSLYMVMEMCKKGVVMKVGLGESADAYPEETCRLWFRDLILGIEYLHSQGVVHRDIKPENLLLTEDDVLKIVDFGVSEMFQKSEDMRTSKSAGSPAFLPPELCVAKHGDVSGKAADIWSMGVSLYCLRYGRIPFERDGILSMYEAIKTEIPKLPVDENPDFLDLMGSLLEKDPEKRITMAELREHPWVTKGGADPLLSAEENCSDPVDPPNSLELNHAFTRRMSHLICVMKAISKFKGLLTPKPTPSETPSSAPPPENPSTTAEFAARVLRERHEFLSATRGGGKASLAQLLNPPSPITETAGQQQPSSMPNHQQQQNHLPPVLGIGTGGIDDFPTTTTATTAAAGELPCAGGDVVSDSPTAVDFNVYDRAFEEECERIRQSTSRRGGAADAGGMAPAEIYQTKFSERGERGFGGGGNGSRWGFAAGVVASQGRGQQESVAGSRFAELVAKAMEGAGRAGEGGGAGDGGSGGAGAGSGGESNQS